jgi:hypothetical protein
MLERLAKANTKAYLAELLITSVKNYLIGLRTFFAIVKTAYMTKQFDESTQLVKLKLTKRWLGKNQADKMMYYQEEQLNCAIFTTLHFLRISRMGPRS